MRRQASSSTFPALHNGHISAELIGFLGVGAALGGLVLLLQSRTDKRLDVLEGELRQLGERVARLEGLIKGSGQFRPADAPALTLSSEHGSF